MKRPAYREAIQWLADNDDCTWASAEPDRGMAHPPLSVTASLVSDMFGAGDERVWRDLCRVLAREGRL